MDSSNSLTERIRNWFDRSPKAQRAYQRLSTDLDTVVERVDSATSGLRERISPIIDPSRPEPAGQAESGTLKAEKAETERQGDKPA